MAPEIAMEAEPAGEAGEHRIPKERVDAMLASAKADLEKKLAAAEERARLESERRRELETRSQPSSASPPSSPEPAPPTRAQLLALVEDGKITQEAMDAELERQAEVRVEKRLSEKMAVRDRASKINDRIDLYLAKIPDLKDPSSDSYQRVKAKFAALRKLEYPNDASTELLALDAIFGDVDKMNVKEIGNKERETNKTTHGGAGSEKEEEESKGPGPLKGLSQEFKDYYQKGIDEGRYSGWDDPHLIRVQKRAIAHQ